MITLKFNGDCLGLILSKDKVLGSEVDWFVVTFLSKKIPFSVFYALPCKSTVAEKSFYLGQWFGHYFGKKAATNPINTGFFLFIASYVFG